MIEHTDMSEWCVGRTLLDLAKNSPKLYLALDSKKVGLSKEMKLTNFHNLCLLWLIVNILGACATLRQSCPEEEQNKAQIHTQLGAEYIRQGKNDVALEKLEKALAHCSYFAEAHNAMGVLYDRVGEDDKAKPYYQKALALEPTGSDIHNNYGQFLCKHGKWDEADKHFLQALENPVYRTPEIPYTNAGLCALRHKDTIKAETYLRQALQKNPKFPRALYQMASLSYEQKRHQQARRYLQRYLEIAKHTPQTLWLGIRIERTLNNRDMEASYALLLRKMFPDSKEIQLLNQLERP